MIDYLAHMGIVRVASIPLLMTLALYLLYRLAAPPPDVSDDDDSSRS